jgi:hypothetical protein
MSLPTRERERVVASQLGVRTTQLAGTTAAVASSHPDTKVLKTPPFEVCASDLRYQGAMLRTPDANHFSG